MSNNNAKKENIKISDFGEKIGGARKDLWKERGLCLDDFESLDEREYQTFVNKENVWPTPDYKALVDDGMAPVCAYYLKYVRDKLPSKPISGSKEHSMIYIQLVSVYKAVLSGLKDIAELKHEAVRAKLEAEANEIGFKYLRVRPYFQTFKAALLSEYEIKKMETEALLQNFPNDFKGALKGLTIVEYRTLNGPCFIVAKGRERVSFQNFTKYEDAVKHAQEEIVPALLNSPAKKRQKKSVDVVRPQLANIKRIGADVRRGRNVTGEELIEAFGFRGGEFGNWETQDDRIACLNYAYEAFYDLASVLNLPIGFISLGGYKDKKLAIAFGARGKGSAAAHYEPSNVVINLTKMKGAGSLAHEWAHALDDFLGIRCANVSMLSSLPSRCSNVDLYLEVMEKFKELMDVIKYRPAASEEILANKNKEIDRYKRGIENETRYLASFYGATEEQKALIEALRSEFISNPTQESFEVLCSAYKKETKRLPSKDTRDRVNNLLMFIQYDQRAIAEFEATGKFAHVPKLKTSFFNSAVELDKYKSQPYYQKNEELLARAFEGFVEDKIKSFGNRSDYLVHSTQNQCYMDLSPYPQDEEREQINRAFDEFMPLIRKVFVEPAK